MSDDTDITTEAAQLIFSHLEAERIGPNRPALAVHERALLHRAAHLLATGTGDAKDIATLLQLAPSIVSPGAKPAPTLQDVCRADAPWDLTRLSHQQLTQLEEISATAQGRASPVSSPRLEAALALTAHLDADVAVDMPRVRGLLLEVLAPLTFEDVHPSHHDALVAERGRRMDLERDVERLERQLASVPSNVVNMRAAAAAAADAGAPVVSRSNVDVLGGMVSSPGRGFIGDHPG